LQDQQGDPDDQGLGLRRLQIVVEVKEKGKKGEDQKLKDDVQCYVDNDGDIEKQIHLFEESRKILKYRESRY
jgi:hypothetical protein